MSKITWLLPTVLCAAAAIVTVIAFRRSVDRSAFALVHWGVIAVSIAVSPFVVRELHSASGNAPSARARLVRIALLIYLPLSSALSLLAFRGH